MEPSAVVAERRRDVGHFGQIGLPRGKPGSASWPEPCLEGGAPRAGRMPALHIDRHLQADMRTNDSRSSSSISTRGTTTPADRRRRTRLRDLCDEVLASYRMARQADPFTDQDRAQGRAILSSVLRSSR